MVPSGPTQQVVADSPPVENSHFALPIPGFTLTTKPFGLQMTSPSFPRTAHPSDSAPGS